MKKALFFALSLFVAATALVSCGDKNKGKDEPATGVTITFATNEITLAPGDEERLKYTITPAGTSVTLTWATSNAAVATVSQSGIVTAVGDGEAVITASYQDAKAECKVTVTSEAIYENFGLVGYGLFGSEFVPVPGTDTIISLTIGDCNVQLATIAFIGWDGNVLYASGWAGYGLIIESEICVYLIVDGPETQAASAAYGSSLVGFYVGSDSWQIADLKGAGYDYYPYAAQSGSINVQNFGTVWSYMLDTTYCSLPEAQEAYANMVNGAYVYAVDADNDEFYSDRPYAVVNEMILEEDDNEEVLYDIVLTWGDLYGADRFYGLKCTLDEEGYVNGIVKPFDYATVGPREYANYDFSAQAPAKKVYKLGDMSLVHNEIPEFVVKARELRKTQMYRK